MVDFLVIIKSEGVFPSVEFKDRLLERWPIALTRDLEGTSRQALLDFEISMARSTLYGTFFRGGKSVSFSGDLADCAAFAHWCRLLIPANEDVMFCDEMVNMSLDLNLDTTPSEIVDAVMTS